MRALSLSRWWLALAAFAAVTAFVTVDSPHAQAEDQDYPDAWVVIEKIIDGDGNLATTGDQTSGVGWEFDIEVIGGDPSPSNPVTNEHGFAYSDIHFGDTAYVTVIVEEVDRSGYALIGWECEVVSSEEVRRAAETEGSNGDEVGYDETLWCEFYNKPAPTPTVRPRTATPEPTEPLPATATPPAPTSTPAGEPAGVVIPPQPPAPVAPVALPSTGSGPAEHGFPWLTAGALAALTLAAAGFALRRRRA